MSWELHSSQWLRAPDRWSASEAQAAREAPRPDQRVAALGIDLPARATVGTHVHLPFAWAKVVGPRLVTSGHGSLGPDGSPLGPFGRVPDEVTVEEAKASAGRAGAALLSTIRSTLGSLERVEEWVSVAVLVNAADGFGGLTEIANVISDLVLEVFGTAGVHTRTTAGATSLPMGFPVVVAAEVVVRPTG